MPYKKTYTKKRYTKKRYNGQHKYIRYAGGAMDVASKALTVAYGIKRLVNVEYKFHDVTLTLTTVAQTPIITQLTNIPQGDTDISRDGAQVKLVRINVKYLINSHVDALFTQIRCMLVHDRQTNQAIYSATDLLSDITGSDAIVSLLNLDNKYRFQVLYNKVHTLSNVGRTSSAHQVSKELSMKLRYDASTPSIADLTSSSLSWIFISNHATTSPEVTFFSRVRYIDN